MLPATAWDDRQWGSAKARGWTVMSRLRERQKAKLAARRDASRRLRGSEDPTHRDRLAAEWDSEYALLAFLFAMPDELTIEMLDARKPYFDVRTGEHWDLFFPGYFCSDAPELEDAAGSVRMHDEPVGSRHTSNWYFNETDFNDLRAHVERASEFRWQFSGGADLVIAEMIIPASGGPTIDWTSTRAGTILPPNTLAGVIEKITSDLERELEDPDHGVGDLVKPASEKGGESRVEKILISAVGNVVATAVKTGIHLQGQLVDILADATRLQEPIYPTSRDAPECVSSPRLTLSEGTADHNGATRVHSDFSRGPRSRVTGTVG